MKSFTHMSCKYIRLLETFSLSARQFQHTCNVARNCLQTGHVIPLNRPSKSQSISDLPSLTYSRLADVHDHIPSQLPHFSNLKTYRLNMDSVFNEGVGYNPRLLLGMRKSLIKCIHKGGGHTRYDLQYLNL